MAMPFGLIITIICFSGATLVFEDEITNLLDHQFYNVESRGESVLPMNELVDKVASILPDSVKITGVTVFADENKAYKVNLSKPRKAAIYIDQYSGDVKGHYQRLPFFQFMFRLHRWLLDSMKPQSDFFLGRVVVGVSTIMFAIIIISGMIIWMPHSVKAIRSRFKLVLNKGKHRLFFTLHAVGGTYAAILLLIMALTGLTWSFTWYRTAFYQVFGVEQLAQAPHGKPNENKGRAEGRGKERGTIYTNWQQVLETLQHDCNNYSIITINDGNASVATAGWGNQRSSDKYMFNSATGALLDVEYYKDQPSANKMRGWIYSVHSGIFAGCISKIAWFIAALIGAILPITGYYLWFKKRLKSKR